MFKITEEGIKEIDALVQEIPTKYGLPLFQLLKKNLVPCECGTERENYADVKSDSVHDTKQGEADTNG